MLASRPPSVLLLLRSRPAYSVGVLDHRDQRQNHRPSNAGRRPRLAATAAAGDDGKRAVDLLPQNTPEPRVLPGPSLATPLAAAAAQLDALAAPALDDPWPLHGVGVAYAFCADGGSLELSRYFAPGRASLYHQDHFQGKFLARFPGLVGHGGWRLEEAEEEEDGVAAVRVRVAPSSSSSSSSAAAAAAGAAGPEGDDAQTYVFVLVRQEAGLRKGSWVTKQLVRLGEDGAPV